MENRSLKFFRILLIFQSLIYFLAHLIFSTLFLNKLGSLPTFTEPYIFPGIVLVVICLDFKINSRNFIPYKNLGAMAEVFYFRKDG